MVKLHEDQETAAFPRTIENGMSRLMLARQGSTVTLNGPGGGGLRFRWFTLPGKNMVKLESLTGCGTGANALNRLPR